jgi:hypothetical protein
MSTEHTLLETWRKLDLEKQQKVLEYMHSLNQNNQTQKPQESYQPKTPLGKKLWELRLKSLGNQPILNTWEEVEQELAERRGGISE